MLIFTKRFYRAICISILLLSKTLPVSSQTEYLVIVDPSTGKYTKTDSIPGVKYILLFELTTIDEKNKRFIFTGGPDQTNFNIITLDAVNGNILSKDLLLNSGILGELIYSRSADILYGLIVNGGIYSLVSFNSPAGTYSILKTFPGNLTISYLTLDDTGHRFFMQGIYNGVPALMTLDIPTGNITSQLAIPNSVVNIHYDGPANKLYGLSYRPDASGNSIFSTGVIDPGTGTFTRTADIPGMQGFLQGNATFDANKHRYIFVGSDNVSNTLLYSVDVVTGKVLYQPPVSLTNQADKDNLIQFRFDNTSGLLYALHWEAKTPNIIADSSCKLDIQTHIYPNPFGSSLIVKKPPSVCSVRMNLYTALGQILIQDKIINNGENTIPLMNLATGVYFYKFFSNGRPLQSGKILKQ